MSGNKKHPGEDFVQEARAWLISHGLHTAGLALVMVPFCDKCYSPMVAVGAIASGLR